MSFFRPSKPAPRPVVRKNDDYNPSVNRPSAAPSKRPDRDRGVDKGGRKPAGGPSNKPSRDPRQADRGDRGRGQQKGDKDKGAAKKEQKVRMSWPALRFTGFLLRTGYHQSETLLIQK